MDNEMTFDPDKIPSYFLRRRVPLGQFPYLEAEDVLQEQHQEARRGARRRRRSLSASPIYWRSSIVVSWQRRKKAASANRDEGEDLQTASKASVLGKKRKGRVCSWRHSIHKMQTGHNAFVSHERWWHFPLFPLASCPKLGRVCEWGPVFRHVCIYACMHALHSPWSLALEARPKITRQEKKFTQKLGLFVILLSFIRSDRTHTHSLWVTRLSIEQIWRRRSNKRKRRNR